MEDYAKLCRNTYCELVPGKRTWEELSDKEREIDVYCLKITIEKFLSDKYEV